MKWTITATWTCAYLWGLPGETQEVPPRAEGCPESSWVCERHLLLFDDTMFIIVFDGALAGGETHGHSCELHAIPSRDHTSF